MSSEYEMNRFATLARQLGAATSQRIVRWEQKDSDLYGWGATEGLVTVASRDRDGEPPYELAVQPCSALCVQLFFKRQVRSHCQGKAFSA